MVGSALWPVLVVVAVEILTRVDWPPSGRWLAARWCGLLPVALVSAVISYGHGRGLLLHWGEGELAAALGPLAPDGLMVIASSALLIRRPDTDTVPSPVSVEVATPRPVPVLAVSAPVTPPDTDTGTDTAPEHTAVPVPRNAKVMATAACTSTARTVREHVPAPDTPDAVLADTLRASGTRTVRGAQAQLHVGRACAYRVLAFAWPDTGNVSDIAGLRSVTSAEVAAP